MKKLTILCTTVLIASLLVSLVVGCQQPPEPVPPAPAPAPKPEPTPPMPPPPENVEIRLAPIHEVKVTISESDPPQVIVYIKGGLEDGCTTFHELTTERSGNNIYIRVTTQRPKGAQCAQIYGYFEKYVNLGNQTPGETYNIKVNEWYDY